MSRRQIALLLLITIAAVSVHGYHPSAEDGELYLPGIKKYLNGVRDNGSVSMFPGLGDEWDRQMKAHRGWQDFQLHDFERLQRDYGVTWFILQRRDVAGLSCPYQNEVVAVCHLD